MGPLETSYSPRKENMKYRIVLVRDGIGFEKYQECCTIITWWLIGYGDEEKKEIKGNAKRAS